MGCDPFLEDPVAKLPESLLAALSEDSPTREVLTKHRNELLEAILPLLELPKEQAQEAEKAAFEEMPASQCSSCLLYEDLLF